MGGPKEMPCVEPETSFPCLGQFSLVWGIVELISCDFFLSKGHQDAFVPSKEQVTEP